MPLNPLDELTLNAYLAALPKLTEPLPPVLQHQLSAIAPRLLQDPTTEVIDTLRDLIGQHPLLNALYQAERLALQSPEGQRNKFLTSVTANPIQSNVDQASHPLPEVASSGEKSITPSGSLSENSSHGTFTHAVVPDLTSTNGHDSAKNGHSEGEAESVDQPRRLADPSGSAPPLVQRFVLRDRPTEVERQYYKKYISELQRLNPNWQILLDQPKPDESAAYVAIYQDAETSARYKTYLATRCIEDMLIGFHL
ncbi:MAG: hypothetical protein NW224_14125 [Leptolyngbyaceae cyanobacterium bins.302]|nr:hypothetical protein [Leptolyngbyaceae cyanobacterium bins.302]